MIYYTSIEQSKKLLELGLNSESADMWWLYVTAQGKHIAMMYEEPDPHYLARMESYGIQDAAIPCWSLGALLKVMPKSIVVGGRNYFSYIATLDTISYGDTEGYMTIKFSYDSLFESCFQMVIWLLENGFIKK